MSCLKLELFSCVKKVGMQDAPGNQQAKIILQCLVPSGTYNCFRSSLKTKLRNSVVRRTMSL